MAPDKPSCASIKKESFRLEQIWLRKMAALCDGTLCGR
jgi:hypothetical protein